MCGWQEDPPVGTGRGCGIAFARYKNRAAYAAVAVEVEVDEEIRVSRAWCAADAGLVINPDGAINQLEGGIIQATSWVLSRAGWRKPASVRVTGTATRYCGSARSRR